MISIFCFWDVQHVLMVVRYLKQPPHIQQIYEQPTKTKVFQTSQNRNLHYLATFQKQEAKLSVLGTSH